MKRWVICIVAILCLLSGIAVANPLGGSPMGGGGSISGTPIGEGDIPGSAIESPWWFRGLTFWAPFDNPDLPLTLHRATGSLSFTRATIATYVHPTTGLITMAGENGFLYSEDFSNENWSVSGSITVTVDSAVSPNGNTTADLLTKSGGAAYILQSVSGFVVGNTYTASLYIMKDSVTSRFPEFGFTMGVASLFTQLNTSTGEKVDRVADGTVSSSVVDAGTYWRLVLTGVNQGTAFSSYLRPAAGTTLGVYDANATGSIIVSQAQLNMGATPTTYIKTTAAAANALRIEANGALIEGQRTNIATYSDDLTNAAWVKVTMTAAMDQIGPDGVANSASSITATGANATILQTVVSDNSAHSYAVYLKRLSGTGAVNITIDNTMWTAQTITSSWARYKKENTTVLDPLDPIIGIQLATSGDSVAVALNQLEVAAFSSSPIPTTMAAVTRNLSSLSVASSGNIDNTAGTFYTSWTPNFANTVTASGNYYFFDAGGLEAYWNSTDDKIYLTDGTNTISTAALTFSADVAKDLAFTWGASGLSITVDGIDTTGATYTEVVEAANTFIGADTSSANLLYGHEKNFRNWNRQFILSERIAIAP